MPPAVDGSGARLRDEPSQVLRSRMTTSLSHNNSRKDYRSAKFPIPAKLHYVWFGKGAMSDEMRAGIDEWKQLMPDFEVFEWNESNVDIDSHPYLKRMHSEGKYAFASDYARLLVLQEHGGIYLDTDVRMKKSLSHFTSEQCFWSFEFDHFISTAVIGSRREHPFINLLLDEYDHLDKPVVNNVLVTRAFMREFPEFRLNNKDQVVGEDIRIFPKEYMVIPSFDKDHNFSVHLANNHWAPSTRRMPWGTIARSLMGDVIFYKLLNLKMGWGSDFRAMEKARRRK